MPSMKDQLGEEPPAWANAHEASRGYPQSPGYKTTGTSQDAAKAVASTAADLRARCLEHIRQSPSTADETAKALGASVLAVRPRISELRFNQQVREKIDPATGKAIRRQNESGQSATVWEAVPPDTRPEQKTLPL